MERCPAWLLQPSLDLACAVAQHEMIEYLTEVQAQRVPLANPYCEHLVVWRDRLVPVVDLECLLNGARATVELALSIVAYQPGSRLPLEYLGLWCEAAPSRVKVDDDQACDLPAAWHDSGFREIALSCFLHEETAVPILNLTRLARTSYH